ncbi:LTV1, protein LTV1 [Babesia microti strain RI]|uniref:LTV1, protein LTV1 n=1 Tax=Babesia microti (strain RI) TaxID=1133968 RepID=A0A1R4AA62_BABMR|nr:LTV1, protein LTV1 [Babesia microti strain RI]SJK85880.1 LTV1, protein LTV1 [Babesia microti strain RI]|eukprot:XP_021338091.1 LTV1, protein LTV1 [Babesia microti strain RI]
MVSGRCKFKSPNSVSFKLVNPGSCDFENNNKLQQRVLQPNVSYNRLKSKKQEIHQESGNISAKGQLNCLNNDLNLEYVHNSDSKSPESGTISHSSNTNILDKDIIELSDCYFPLDDYDYSQHLRTIRDTNFIPFRQFVHNEFIRVNDGNINKHDNLSILDKDVEDECELEEEIDDDFVFQAAGTDNLDEIDISKIIWGESATNYSSRTPLDRNISIKIDGDEVVAQDSPSSDYSEFDRFINEYDDGGDNNAVVAKDIVPMAHNKVTDGVTLVPVDKELINKIVNMDYMSENDSNFSDKTDSNSYNDDWDCETVIISLSNLLNNPKKISQTNKLLSKESNKLSVKFDNINSKGDKSQESTQSTRGKDCDKGQMENLINELPPIVVTRRKDETPEEKKQRKCSVKQARALIRQVKKENKILYKNVKLSQQTEKARNAYDIPSGVRHYVMGGHTK